MQTYTLRQLRMNSDDVKLLYSYPSPYAVNLRRPDAPTQVPAVQAGASLPRPIRTSHQLHVIHGCEPLADDCRSRPRLFSPSSDCSR